jgi:hypothetical protein
MKDEFKTPPPPPTPPPKRLIKEGEDLSKNNKKEKTMLTRKVVDNLYRAQKDNLQIESYDTAIEADDNIGPAISVTNLVLIPIAANSAIDQVICEKVLIRLKR